MSLVPLDPADPILVRAWCAVINDAFGGMAGHSTLTPASLVAHLDPAAEFPGGSLLAFEGGRAVGLVAVKKDTDEAGGTQAYLGPVAVIRDRQKRGLGRALLRAGLAAAQAKGFTSCVLTVNAENEKALGLYLAEGFARRAVYTCWARPCP
jgi:mycothiol synthase